jgi:D-lactate dehydrogenase
VRIAVFGTRTYGQHFLARANEQHGHGHEFTGFEARLVGHTALLTAGYPVVCAIINDRLTAAVLHTLHEHRSLNRRIA